MEAVKDRRPLSRSSRSKLREMHPQRFKKVFFFIRADSWTTQVLFFLETDFGRAAVRVELFHRAEGSHHRQGFLQAGDVIANRARAPLEIGHAQAAEKPSCSARWQNVARARGKITEHPASLFSDQHRSRGRNRTLQGLDGFRRNEELKVLRCNVVRDLGHR